jgi:hypothetical protein
VIAGALSYYNPSTWYNDANGVPELFAVKLN